MAVQKMSKIFFRILAKPLMFPFCLAVLWCVRLSD